MNFTNLNDDNVLLYALYNYENPNCITLKEFLSDFKLVKFLVKIFNKYGGNECSVINERLVLNHLTVLYNVFNNEAITRILFLKVPKKHHSTLKPFLLFLNKLPSIVGGVNEETLYTSSIAMDAGVINKLRTINEKFKKDIEEK